MRRLIAALDALRADLGVVIADLEADNKQAALAGMERTVEKLKAAMKALRV